MGLTILIIEVILIVLLDRKIYKTYYTPCIMLSVPFIIICVLYDLNSSRLGLFPLNYNVLYIWVFGLFFFWLMGVFTYTIVPSPKSVISQSGNLIKLQLFSKKLLNFTFFLSVILTYFLYKAYNLYITTGGDAAEAFLGSGVHAHLVIYLKLLSILSFLSLFIPGNALAKFKNIYIILIALALSVMYGTKSGILLLLLSYFLAWIFVFNKKIKFLHIFFAFVLGYGIFYLSYSMVFGYLAPIDFIWNHMILYYVSGTGGMNVYFTNSGPVGIEPDLLFRFFFNVFYTITGNSKDVKTVISEEWTYIGIGNPINVRTFFGTLYLYGGEYFGLFAVIFYSFLVHLVFKLSRGNFLFLILYVYILSMLCFGWFDFYFNSVAFYETIFLCILLGFVLVQKVRRS